MKRIERGSGPRIERTEHRVLFSPLDVSYLHLMHGLLRSSPSVLACVVLAIGCGDEPKPEPSPGAIESARQSASAALSSAAAPDPTVKLDPPDTPLPAAGAPGAAYFVVEGRGLVLLAASREGDDQNPFVLLEGSPQKGLEDLQQSGSGGLYVKGPEGIMKLEGAELKLVAKIDEAKLGNVNEFVVAPDDKTIWIASLNGVGRWDGTAWTTEPRSAIADTVRFIQGLALDGDGNVWVAASNTLHVKTKDGWKDVTPPSDRRQFWKSLETGPGGEVYALSSSALYKGRGEKVTPVEVGLGRRLLFEHLSVAKNGVFAFQSDKKEVARSQVGAAARTYGAKDDSLVADGIQAVAVDEKGRVWVPSKVGLSIVGPGSERVEFATGTVDLLRGEITGLVVVGAGPSLPPVPEAKMGGLKGRLTSGGAPLAATEVEVCPKPALVAKTSPCAESAVKFAVTTDATGGFAVEAVPLGTYGLAAKVGDEWRVSVAQRGQRMKEGETLDLGVIALDKK